MGRIAARYGLEPTAVSGWWQWRGQRPRHESGAVRADAEVVLDGGGRRVLAGLCGVPEGVLGRALPAWAVENGTADGGAASGSDGGQAGRGVWRVAGAVVGPVAFGCRLCTARRCGAPVGVVRYARGWERVCVRHGLWLLDADADLGKGMEFLDLRALPEVVAAQRRWRVVARRAVRAGVEPGSVFAMARAVVCRWWEQALEWEQEKVWPARLHALAGGDASGDFWRWRAVGRDAAVFPEAVEVAAALLDPAMAELVWVDSGAGRPRPLPVDGEFCRQLGERVGRGWLGRLAAADLGGPLIAWMGAIIRERRRTGAPAMVLAGEWDERWRVRQELRPPTTAAQLRVLGKDVRVPGSGTSWRSAVEPERRMLIQGLLEDAQEQVEQLRGAQRGSSAEASERLLRGIAYTVGLLRQAAGEAALGALEAGVRAEDVVQWAGRSPAWLAELLGDDGEGGPW
ncbi:DNA-binding protein [Kitasatospora cineracea]|uniref:DNA-binding protein n=1 Tax=Kitasatospora cineracea TaxID=88074 RepID=UPI001FC98FBA|nr:DNA-binding protein [Kitasatospora cineracea]